ncbi:ricin-type beta-trefoil lectin domain protein [Streptomyces sp. NBC_00847]|uniref:ricin-type beta-trefoil lectin domain protein n=1 Tax=unclassified Streptomyces TaxID=2593676 RepID=UPI00225AE5B2|nr:ricin-type beta-trefoil lectin domain protein [Streptomyces sp. NBC_00847]MCX4878423.1 ricin-type beta-trefoil lectin domain protein [Streptomyces sp. NBC_00847]
MYPPPRSPRRGLVHRCRAAAVRLLALALTVAAALLFAAPGPAQAATTRQIAVPTAPMGWASWNSFAAKIDYNVIKQQVDAFVAAGLPAAGYKYINIDEGWWQGTRDSAGNITVDTGEWPGGMSAIADYIHSKGLKAGIYTDAGKNGCGYYYPTGRPAAANTGSEGHYDQDMLQFSKWGFDFVKVDWCGGDVEGLDAATAYQSISDAVAKATATTGRPLTLSICNWGKQNPWNWAPGQAPMWRTSTDIIYYGNSPSMTNLLSNFDQTLHPTAQHTGYYNDPDMLMVGMDGFTAAQNRTHMNLWAISGAPLLAGNNLATMSSETASILKNPEVVAVDQDPRGLQGVKVAEDTSGLQVYGKALAGTGNRAVVLLNRTSSAQNITVRWSDLGLTDASATVRDLWARTNAGTHGTSYTTSVPAGGSVMLTVTGGTEASSSTYTGTSSFSGVAAGSTGVKIVDVSYTNNTSSARTGTLKVNGQGSTAVSFPPTGAGPGTISVQVGLSKGATNSLTFSGAPTLDSITVRPQPGTDGTQVVGKQSGHCLDIYDHTITNGTQAELWDCNGGQNQAWTYTSRKELVVYGNKCLDAYDNGTTNGTKAVIWDCNGQNNQKWNVNSDGTITNVNAGLCLDAYNNGTANGTFMVLWTCGTGDNQKWTLN